ncbi:DUF7553 family protein [Halorussus caseinilyticus]|uniref:Uncharacterized protein n=1 Tax=Halorussus caseinilyticus TaxID=3034025 RepID=A0ABD5WGW4_9EURY|nr:hypothetical protein [Halorussus sp. DT72]
MNKHFEDAWYYARRAGKHLGRGVREELEPAERRVRKATGREREELNRAQRWRAELKRTEDEAADRARRAVRKVRRRA